MPSSVVPESRPLCTHNQVWPADVCQLWARWIQDQAMLRDDERERRVLTTTELDALCGRLQHITPATEHYIRYAMSSLQTGIVLL